MAKRQITKDVLELKKMGVPFSTIHVKIGISEPTLTKRIKKEDWKLTEIDNFRKEFGNIFERCAVCGEAVSDKIGYEVKDGKRYCNACK